MNRSLLTFFLLLQFFVVLPSASTAFAQEDELIDMAIGFLSDSNKEMRAAGLDVIRDEAKGVEATKKFAAQLPKLKGNAVIGLISALADRGDTTAKAAILPLLKQSDEAVRVAVIRSVAKLGSTPDCALLASCLNKSKAEAEAARTALTQIQGDEITTEIANQLSGATTSSQVALIEILASRRAFDTIPKLLKLSTGNDAKIRTAAMNALGAIGSPKHIPDMLKGILKASRGAERSNAERQVATICNRIEEADKRAEPLLAAIDKLPAKDQTTLMVTIGRVGGPAAMSRVVKAVDSKDRAMHSAGLAALANWPNASVAPKLMELAYKDPHVKHQRAAVRAIIRVAPMNDGRSNEQKLELLKKVMDMSVLVEDRRYALQRAGAIRIVDSLRWILPFVDDPRYAEQACTSIVELAHIRDLRDDNKAEFHAALDKVLATSKNAETLERATQYKAGRTWVRP